MYTKHKWNSDVHYNFSYVKYLPKDFDESKKYPLVIFLHGAGDTVGANDHRIPCSRLFGRVNDPHTHFLEMGHRMAVMDNGT